MVTNSFYEVIHGFFICSDQHFFQSLGYMLLKLLKERSEATIVRIFVR